ncbi:ATP-binding protein [Desulfosarcina cetonica]|uniref:ATP-binding protein n=1 Tax=Desulfosarcina cetonica TaxID=90730 RepID=UPI0009F942B9|nr:ATP-binding protein [Desulfosarcina cetonica]
MHEPVHQCGPCHEARGGDLTITIGDVLLEAGIEGLMDPLKAGRYGVLAISDTGCGIPAEEMGSIFEPYFTTKDVGEGTGLGLAVVHGIISGYGGDIQVTSTPGQGSCFKVFLPCIENPDIPEKPALAEHLPGGTEHILIVDDELVIARVGARMLERKAIVSRFAPAVSRP